MTRVRAYVSSLNPHLPVAWPLEAGFLVNAFGTGVAYPFLVIYLHNVRGFSLGTAGLVIARSGAAGLVAGPLSDGRRPRRREGDARDGARPRRVRVRALSPRPRALVGLPGRVPGRALERRFWPSQFTLLAGLAPPARRHARRSSAACSTSASGLGGMTGGLIASTADRATFTVLFVVDAPRPRSSAPSFRSSRIPGLPPAGRDAASPRGGYRDVLRNRPFMGLVALNVAFVAAGYTQLELLPVFAKNEAGVTERSIGLIFLASSARARPLPASRRQARSRGVRACARSR